MNDIEHILILEDNQERINAFEKAVDGEWVLKIWRDAPTMIDECSDYLPDARLVSLDHDLNPQPGAVQDPGTGVDVAKFLSIFPPSCPVILHSSNHERVYSMLNELRFAGWALDRVGPFGDDWIGKSWLKRVREFLADSKGRFDTRKPIDHQDRLERALVSLNGLAIGDGIGEMFFSRPHRAPEMIQEDRLPAGPWFHTDDTEMALSIVEVLEHHGFLHQDALARRFAARFEKEPMRGYGRMTRIQLQEVLRGEKWAEMASSAFGGQGSLGNGGAMRVAPLGAYFADDLERVASEAANSSTVTHTHAEGIAGTISIAVAAAVACKTETIPKADFPKVMFEAVLYHTPGSKCWDDLEKAPQIQLDADPVAAGRILGNGSKLTAPDTVPFAVWCATRHIDDYPAALGVSICSGGDCDTNAAIVGGIVACSTGRVGIPDRWFSEMELLNIR